ncbi:AraC family transcriptional regulator [Pseudomonas sp. PP3]|uniref:helix-turn-helix transcriptional regulator n=1 Tax=Pseudomonas sp. PP3 TaxID=2815936 RepID=UPI001BAEAF50|nr:AraC family transcriptional regulator [Pseudomonas sp. PP3]
MHDDFALADRKNSVSVWTMKDLYDAELLKGAYFDHRYPWHAHAEFSLGVVLAGGVSLQTRRSESVATRGSFVFINAEEMHRGHPQAQGWRCRTLHIDPEVLRRVNYEIFGRHHLPWFASPVIEDRVLTSSLLRLHQLSEATCSSLERQSWITSIIARLLTHHGHGLDLLNVCREPIAVERARAFLDANLSDKVTLDQLALVAQIPAFRLLRAFRQAFGVTPHEYQLQARVRSAHTLLKIGVSLADAAVTSGFSDQPHFTRVYKKIMGATPGQFGREERNGKGGYP